MSMIVVNNDGIAGMMLCTPLKCLSGEVGDMQMPSVVLDIEDIRLIVYKWSTQCAGIGVDKHSRKNKKGVKHASTNCHESLLTESY